MNTRHINTRLVLSSALAAGIFFASAPMQAQAPTLPSEQKLEAKVESLQAQVTALQAQVKRLQAQVRIFAPRRGVTPIDQLPPFQVPNKIEPFQNPGILREFGIPGNQFPGTQGPPQLFVPRIYSNIPPCTITLITQKTP